MNHVQKIISQNLDKIDIKEFLVCILNSQIEADHQLKNHIRCSYYEEKLCVFVYASDFSKHYKIKIIISTNLEVSEIVFEWKTRSADYATISLGPRPPLLDELAEMNGSYIRGAMVEPPQSIRGIFGLPDSDDDEQT